jgi:uncharacterized protein involved in exopolysaccharide biosynthesis
MLQNAPSNMQLLSDAEDQGLDPSHYYEILKKRILYVLVPFIVVFAVGAAVAMLWPPTYLSEGKILVESQQIPVDLVRPTVTATGKERIQVIQQRVMTRDNLLAIVDKYQMFADRRDRLSRTELLDLMRQSSKVEPIEFDQARGKNETIAITVGFMHQRPDIAAKVANELLTLFLNEDARNRTNRAMETTKFLAREAQRLEGELGSVEAKISELKRQRRSNPMLEPVAGQLPQLAMLKAEFAQKSAVYSKTHPELKRLKVQIEALEKMNLPAATPASTPAAGPTVQVDNDSLDALLTQRTSIQKNLESAAQKLSAARLGENLERDQFSERLEILEQAIVPQKPIKPNRPKILGLVLLGALMAGIGGVFAVETFDRTIRGSRDLLGIADAHLVVAIPYISTRAELLRKKSRIILAVGILVPLLLGGLLAVHFLMRPLDELWTLFWARLLESWPA